MGIMRLRLYTWINIAFILAIFQRSKAWNCNKQKKFNQLNKIGDGAYGDIFKLDEHTVIKAFYSVGDEDNPCIAAKTDFENHKKIYKIFDDLVVKKGLSNENVLWTKQLVKISEPHDYCEINQKTKEKPYNINNEDYSCYYTQSFLEEHEKLMVDVSHQMFEQWRKKSKCPFTLRHLNRIKGFVHGYMIRAAHLAGKDIEFSIGNYGNMKTPLWLINVMDFGLCTPVNPKTKREKIINDIFGHHDKYVDLTDKDVITGWEQAHSESINQKCVNKFRNQEDFTMKDIRATFGAAKAWDIYANGCGHLLTSMGIKIMSGKAHQSDNNVMSYDYYMENDDYNYDIYGQEYGYGDHSDYASIVGLPNNNGYVYGSSSYNNAHPMTFVLGLLISIGICMILCMVFIGCTVFYGLVMYMLNIRDGNNNNNKGAIARYEEVEQI